MKHENINNAQKLLSPEQEAARQAILRELFPEYINHQSLMLPAERFALISLLQKLRPKHAIEIGTFQGGSLSVLAKYCGKVYTIDTKSDARDKLFTKNFDNVDFIVGNSSECLPRLLDKLTIEKAELSFVLMDGDHSFLGVKNDIERLLTYEPVCPLYILIHDSFNPPCRRAVLDARWAENPYVHFVEVDFVAGNLWPVSLKGHFQMWNGFALAILKPVKRSGDLHVLATSEALFSKAFPVSSVSRDA